jgi:hypothetical protein
LVRLLSACLLSLMLCASNSQAAAEAGPTTLLRFNHTPFPLVEDFSDKPFFDVRDNQRRGHTSRRGGLYWEDTTYNDQRVLVSMPRRFSGYQPAYIVVFLHGNQSTLERDLRDRQQIHTQLAASGLNAVLVAPQFAVDALDSSSGRFAKPGFFNEFLQETAEKVGSWRRSPSLARELKNAKVILVAYSGGYNAAADALRVGGASSRIKGVILLDALYGQEQTFADFLHANHRHSFLFSTYTEPARESNELLMNLLREQGVPLKTELPRRLRPQHAIFLPLGEEVKHVDLLTQAWTEAPLADILRRLR